MTLTLRYAARSDRGLIRDLNQDSVYAGPRLLAIADGMGGMAAGDVASNIVIADIAHLDDDVPSGALVDALRAAVDAANQHLRDAVEANPALEGMGTTLTAMLFTGSKFATVHIGDSRAYLLREGEFVQVTKDDTYVQMLVDEGRISAEEASSHPQRNMLIRALDGRDIEPEYSVRQAVPGDRYLICSDGLSGVVSAETIAATLREYVDPQQCVDRLVQLALRGGGPDNISVVVADVTDEGIVEGVPVVGGAAARDRGNTTSADNSTPAARAAAVAPRRAAPEGASDNQEDDGERPKRHPIRTTLVLLVLLGLLGGGLWYGWRLTQSKYYVGATSDGHVAVFRGVPGEIAGWRLSSVDQVSDITVDDLTKIAQDRVNQGIPANSATDARRKLAELVDPSNGNLQPLCPTPTASPTPSAPPPTPSLPPRPPAGSASAGATVAVPPASAGSPATPSSPPSADSQVLTPSSNCRTK